MHYSALIQRALIQRKAFKNAPKFSALQEFAIVCQVGSKSEITAALYSLVRSEQFQGKAWQRSFLALSSVIKTGAPAFSVFSRSGNSKLPFISWSVLPGGAACPGAGDCLNFCYSYRAWRYPAAFARQAQNTILQRFHRSAIIADLADIAGSAKFSAGFDLRLFVDGDFADVEQVSFWMHTLGAFPMARAYGYSKSFSALVEFAEMGGNWPANYLLNMSSGSNADGALLAAARALPIVRGDFIAVNLGRPVKGADHAKRGHQAELRAAFGAKAFACPGSCGSCTSKGHACGSSAFKGLPVIIAVH